MNYTEAYEELQQIISDIESGEVSVDLLSEKVKRAALACPVAKSVSEGIELEITFHV